MSQRRYYDDNADRREYERSRAERFADAPEPSPYQRGLLERAYHHPITHNRRETATPTISIISERESRHSEFIHTSCIRAPSIHTPSLHPADRARVPFISPYYEQLETQDPQANITELPDENQPGQQRQHRPTPLQAAHPAHAPEPPISVGENLVVPLSKLNLESIGPSQTMPMGPLKTPITRMISRAAPSVAESNHTHLIGAAESSRLTSSFVRPGYGTKGMPVDVVSNFFAVRSTTPRAKLIFHYDVDIDPTVKVGERAQKKPKDLLRTIWAQLCIDKQADEAWSAPFGSCAYDGGRNAFTPYRFPIDDVAAKRFITAVSSDNIVRPAGRDSSSDEELKRWNVTIKLVAIVDLEAVMEYCRNSGASEGKRYKGFSEEKSLTALMATNVLLRHHPSKEYTQVGGTGNRFFTMEGSVPIPQGGVVCKGFLQSFRHSSTGLPLLNIDVAFSTFLASGPALEVIAKILARPGFGGQDDPQGVGGPASGYLGGIQRPPEVNELNKREITIIKHKLRGAKFTVTHRQNNRLHTVMSITLRPAYEINFAMDDRDGGPPRRMSVPEYFQEFYGVPVTKPRLPCIQYGKKSFIPLEFVKLENWNSLPPPKLTAEQTAEMIKVAALRPPDRADAVRYWRAKLAYETQQKIKDWGLQVNSKMVQVKGRILPAPTVLYARDSLASVQDGGWKLRGKQFFKGGRQPLKAWAVVSFDKWCDLDEMQRYIEYLVKAMRSHGMEIINEHPPLVPPADPREIQNVEGALRRAAHMAYANGKWGIAPQLVMIVLPGRYAMHDLRLKTPSLTKFIRDAWLYESIKRISFTKLKAPIPTQCMQAAKIRTPRGIDAYTGNLVMKIQSKLGGVTHHIPMSETPGMVKGKTMLMGADLGHPPIKPGYDSSPTVACSVATFDADCSLFSGQIRLQEGRDEIVRDFSAMIEEHIKYFYKHNKCPPERILIFRDGISEGQYAAALTYERGAVIEACQRLEPGYRPKILVCVCAKRHNTRFFGSAGQVDRSGYLPSGLIVDRSVTHPYTYNFFMQAHRGRVGTARPTHYICLLDELSLTPDQLQQTVHSLCYGFARCTKSVSLVPVCYIADLVCQKARIIVHDPNRGTTIAPSESSAGGGKSKKGRNPGEIDVMQVQDLLSRNPDLSDVMWWM